MNAVMSLLGIKQTCRDARSAAALAGKANNICAR
jgi:hypothetical protein